MSPANPNGLEPHLGRKLALVKVGYNSLASSRSTEHTKRLPALQYLIRGIEI